MNSRIKVFTAAVLGVALGAALGHPVLADQDEVYRLRRENAILPLSDIINRAQARHPGELLEAELEMIDGRYVYEIELYGEDGRYYEIYFDAATGEPLPNIPMEEREE